jgi:hypothetical protein
MKRTYMMRKTRAIDDKLYDLSELRSVWQIRMSNRLLLALMIQGIFPQPRRRAGRLVWREQDIAAYLLAAVKLARRTKWTIYRYTYAPEDTPPHGPVELVAALRLPETKE